MKLRRKIVICISGLLGIFIALIVALIILAPRIINLDTTKDTIKSLASEEIGGELDFQHIAPSLFPHPGAVIRDVSFSVPGNAAGTLKSINIQLELLPLLTGTVVISKLVIVEPDLTLTVTDKTSEKKDDREKISFQSVRDSIQPVLSDMAVFASGIDIEVKKGLLTISGSDMTPFSFKDLNASVTSRRGNIAFDISCRSSLSEVIRLNGELEPDTFSIQGDIALEDIHLKLMTDTFYREASRYVHYNVADLSFGFSITEQNFGVKDLDLRAGKSFISGADAQIDLSKEEPHLEAMSRDLTVDLAELHTILSSIESVRKELTDVRSVDGTVELSDVSLEGTLLNPSRWNFRATGTAQKILFDSAKLPGEIIIHKGSFEATPQDISFSDVRAGMLDTDLNVSGRISNYAKGTLTAELDLKGSAGTETGRWVGEIASIPPRFNIDHLLTIDRAQFNWNGDQIFTLNGRFSIPEGLVFHVDLKYEPAEIDIKNLELRDKESNAVFAAKIKKNELQLKFSGNVTGSTLSQLLVMDQDVKGWIKGDLNTKILLDHPEQFMARGHLEGENIIIPVQLKEELELKKVSLEADKDTINIISSEIVLGRHILGVTGSIKGSADGLIVNADITSDGITWEEIERFLGNENGDKDNAKTESSGAVPIKGVVRIDSEFFSYDQFTWKPIRAVISFDQDELTIDITEAVICAIATPGSITIRNGDISLGFKPSSEKQELKQTLKCLMGADVDMTGTLGVTGKIAAQGRSDELLRSLKGSAEIAASEGMIYRYPFFSRIFALLNVMELFKGKYEDIEKKGFPYDSIKVKVTIKDGKVKMNEMSMDGPSMKLAGSGELDLASSKVEGTFIAAPLRTVDAVVSRIPILKNITAGTLITVAIKVTGKMTNPKVQVVPSSSVGEGVVGIMRRTIELPFTIFDPDDHDDSKSDKQ